MKKHQIGLLMILTCCTAALADTGNWSVAETAGRLEVRHGDAVSFVWQCAPLAEPKGGPKFAGSAFLHSLRTPSGFEWTRTQPPDHLHHFGLWWPWKYVEVEGKKYNTWEIQNGEGGRVACGVKMLPAEPGMLAWEFSNATEIRTSGTNPRVVIDETARVALTTSCTDAQIIDISVRQKAVGTPVTILPHWYSGFAWRGPASWNKDNSRLTASEGQDRETANGQPARWVVVSGPTASGSASVLMMSAAVQLAGGPERLRVWDSKGQNGTPFVNFNPVVEKALPLDDQHPAVSNRKYRVVAADRVIDAAAAEAEWREWTAASFAAVTPKAPVAVEDRLTPLSANAVRFHGGLENDLQNSLVHWNRGTVPYADFVQFFRTGRKQFALGQWFDRCD